VVSCQWSPREDCVLASGGSDGNITLWDVRSSRSRLGTLRRPDLPDSHSSASHNTAECSMRGPVNGLKFSSDGLLMFSLSVSDDVVRVWDAIKCKQIGVVPRPSRKASKKSRKLCVNMACVPKAHSELLFFPDEKAVSVVDVFRPRVDDPQKMGRLVNKLKLHYDAVSAIAFNPFENELYSAGWDNNVLVWSADRRAMADFYECEKEARRLRSRGRTSETANESPVLVPAAGSDSSSEFGAEAAAWNDGDAWSDDDAA
jgi:DNA excision repair protein ERCC-8